MNFAITLNQTWSHFQAILSQSKLWSP